MNRSGLVDAAQLHASGHLQHVKPGLTSFIAKHVKRAAHTSAMKVYYLGVSQSFEYMSFVGHEALTRNARIDHRWRMAFSSRAVRESRADMS